MRWTKREQEVIRLVQAGHSYKAIARELGITRSAVTSYVHRIGRMLPGDQSPLRKLLTTDLSLPRQ